jgi:peroxiredoxin
VTRKTAIVMFLMLFLTAAPALSGCGDGQKQTAAETSPAVESAAAPAGFGVGQPAPDFTLASLAGGDISLRQFRGKAVLVDFWATWCGPCRKAMPHFQDLSETYKDDLAVIAVSLDQEPEKVVPPYIKTSGLTFHVTVDPRAIEVAQTWGGVRSIPTTYLVDRQGKVVMMWLGLNPKETYETEIRKAIGKS